MILFKNTANQVVYTKLMNITGGSQFAVAGLTSSGITGFLSKDGGSPLGLVSLVQQVTGGIYKYYPTQSETNCDVGVFNFSVGATSFWHFNPIYFQTTEPVPAVSLTASTISSIVNSAKGATYDGNITQEKLFEMLIAFMSGQVTRTESGNDYIYSYKIRGGGHTSFTAQANSTTGVRTVQGITGD